MRLSTEASQAAVAAIEEAYRSGPDARALPGWLDGPRGDALAAFVRAGFPSPRAEEWKYTNLAELISSSAERLTRGSGTVDPDRVVQLLNRIPRRTGDHTIVIANGRFEAGLSSLPDANDGIRISTLTDASEADRTRYAAWLSEAARDGASPFAALNAAFVQDAVIVDVGNDAHIANTLHVVFATDSATAHTQTRVLISAGQHSSANVIEHHVGEGDAWKNTTTDIECAESSRLTYVKLQDESAQTDHIAAQEVRLAANSVFRSAQFDLGARLSRNDLGVRLMGPGASAEMFGLFLADGHRHVDNQTRIDHEAGDATSLEHYRGIMNDRGRGVFNGKIIVHDGADGTDAQLNNRNLLLSRTAEIDTKPELEIYTDDVKCAHGATTGQLDELAMFYLRARGIPARVAKHMLVIAFAREILQQFDPAATELADYVNATLERRLPE
ncbi:MAG: Fe-S cluster assembly protein SufD [Gammaproteobacteria bacterium]